ncbi:MAG: hypothetical protein Q9180_001207 [Flavoplaca navasiana]
MEDQTRLPAIQKGVFHPPEPTDLRSPCPVLNALANHGYLPRDGRSIRAEEMNAAMVVVGVNYPIRALLSAGTYLENGGNQATGLFAILRNPLAYAFRRFGLRYPDQVDAEGCPCVDLDQLGRHNVIEHDVSWTRRDAAQGDNATVQKNLVEKMMASASDGKAVDTNDFAKLRRQRLQEQRKDNPEVRYGMLQHLSACGEIAFVQALFGGGKQKKVPIEYIEALYLEERLPLEEGWTKKRRWLPGIGELSIQTFRLVWSVGKIV